MPSLGNTYACAAMKASRPAGREMSTSPKLTAFITMRQPPQGIFLFQRCKNRVSRKKHRVSLQNVRCHVAESFPCTAAGRQNHSCLLRYHIPPVFSTVKIRSRATCCSQRHIFPLFTFSFPSFFLFTCCFFLPLYPLPFPHLPCNLFPVFRQQRVKRPASLVGGACRRQQNGVNSGGLRAEFCIQLECGSPRAADAGDGCLCKQRGKVVWHGVADGCVTGAGDVAAFEHVPQRKVVAQDERAAFLYCGRVGAVCKLQRLSVHGGKYFPEAVLRVHVVEAVFARLWRRHGAQN